MRDMRAHDLIEVLQRKFDPSTTLVKTKFKKTPCPHCGKEIVTPSLARHVKVCPKGPK
jgi:predicted RNA-binding Zn-ribbon protein involved in translation (DUF1610 family)